MVFLHPDQRCVVTKHYAGSDRVRGSAATGKTVVGLHRGAEDLGLPGPGARTSPDTAPQARMPRSTPSTRPVPQPALRGMTRARDLLYVTRTGDPDDVITNALDRFDLVSSDA